MELALDRAREVRGLGAGAVDVGRVPAARMTGLARYRLTSKAPTSKRLEATRQTATLLAAVRHLETAMVDDALDLLHALMATKLLGKAERMSDDAKLKAQPQLRKAAKKTVTTTRSGGPNSSPATTRSAASSAFWSRSPTSARSRPAPRW
ncbi:hypothetical protein AB0O07_33675 [Streptomyces sp. NPDC093085]|uniref:hypothetical protein n=1 Tax=Streptomyces sp. NPDC093085 TaxID=3155068 RepID=UPI00341959AF